MPRYYREEEPSAAADLRPAFNRPPKARRIADVDEYPNTPPSPPRIPNNDKTRRSSAHSPGKKGGHAGAKRKVSGPVRASPRRDTPTKGRARYNSSTSTGTHSQGLSIDSLTRLDESNEKIIIQDRAASRKRKEKQYKIRGVNAQGYYRRKRKSRNVSGAILEEGRHYEKYAGARRRGAAGSVREFVRRRRSKGSGSSGRCCWILFGVIALALIIFVPVGVVLSRKNNSSSSSSNTPNTSSTNGTNLPDRSSIPPAAQGTILDPYTWYDTTDFNTTYTSETVGGLSVMGLFSNWNDDQAANQNTPPLNANWTYGQVPIRGVNLGGWLSIEPFITPSLFNTYSPSDNIIDEYTLSTKLGSTVAAEVLEKHYATFVTEQTFSDIAAAGLDHVRIPYPYWAVTTYEGDPYVPKIAWRYLLRGIEYARKYGLRVNLDLHSLPGSQNGWNHSGRQGPIGWLNGTDGQLNAQRSLDIHNQLSQFFAQDRYKNVITFYGLVNEPRMLAIPVQDVLNWNTQAIEIIRKNGLTQQIVFGDGMLNLNTWNNMFKNVDPHLVLDTHQYMIFDPTNLATTHENKINEACTGWSNLIKTAGNSETGWGPIMSGEFSQADTDCAPFLNDVGQGTRLMGTYNTGDPSTSVLTPSCHSPPCSCDSANANPAQYTSSYKEFLLMYSEAEMTAFENGFGWFYWTWQTESSVQWSWKLGLEAGILPSKAYAPSFTCNSDVPTFSDLSESY